MNRLIVFGIYLFFSSTLLAQTEPIEKANGYEVKILTSAVCEMCKYTIEKDLAFEKGVKTSDLDVESKMLTVIYNPNKTDADKIRKRP